jgi:hypothetical protein
VLQVAMMLDDRLHAGHFIRYLGTLCGTSEGGMEALYSSLQQSQEDVAPTAAAGTQQISFAALQQVPVQQVVIEKDEQTRAEAAMSRALGQVAAFYQDACGRRDARWTHIEAACREYELSVMKARTANTVGLQQEHPAGEKV